MFPCSGLFHFTIKSCYNLIDLVNFFSFCFSYDVKANSVWSIKNYVNLNPIFLRGISVSLRIQSKCGKIRTRITPNTDTFHAVNNLWRSCFSPFSANQMVWSPTSLNERCRTEIENPTSGQISDCYVNLRYLFQAVFNILVWYSRQVDLVIIDNEVVRITWPWL